MDEFVTLLAGREPTTKKFLVHKEFVCRHSLVFKAAFNSDFEEGRTQTYRLEDVPEGAVQMLVQWFNVRKLNTDQVGEKKTPVLRTLELCTLWVLADRLLIPRLQNEVVHELHAHLIRTEMVPTSSLNYLYENTLNGSPIRRLLLYHCAAGLSATNLASLCRELPKKMILELAVQLIKTVENGLPKAMMTEGMKMVDYEVPET
jgi:hypothetical protein